MTSSASHASRDSRLSGRRFLVTGAAGFIGSHLCRRLRDAGADVHAASRTIRDRDDSGLRWWQADLADHATVQRLVRAVNPDVIFHLAACVTGRREREFVLPTFRDNLISTVNLLTEATTAAVRVVLMGSLEESDETPGRAVPCSPYAASKWAASAYGRMFHQLYDMPVTIIRLFMTYGPGQGDLQKLVPHVIISLLQGVPPRLTAGHRPVDWIYVDDVVEGLIAASQAPGLEGATLDLGSGRLVTVREVVQLIVDLVDTKVAPLFGAIPDRPYEQVRVADVDATSSLLGWRPKTPLHQGLAATVDWYRNHLAQPDATTAGSTKLLGRSSR